MIGVDSCVNGKPSLQFVLPSNARELTLVTIDHGEKFEQHLLDIGSCSPMRVDLPEPQPRCAQRSRNRIPTCVRLGWLELKLGAKNVRVELLVRKDELSTKDRCAHVKSLE